MHVTDFEGNEYAIQVTSTNDGEINGNQSLSATILPTKVNEIFINEITEMWNITDLDEVEHKIIYLKKKGEGNSLAIDIKAIPIFFDTLDNDRIYKRYDEHMTAQIAFTRIFDDTGFGFVLNGSFSAVDWEGFGDGESKLETFKRAISRYKCEFRIVGNTVYLETQIGRDTQFMYRHRLNASNIVQEIDANEMWTYAKGYGDYEDSESDSGEGGWENAKLVREYTSPLAQIIGIRHAPPIKDGRVKIVSEMDASLKTLVDESLKVSVSADIHDLRKQGYPIAQSQLGDRVFLIDERINLNDEVRIVAQSITRNWKGEVIDLNVTFGSEGIAKRHQGNVQTAVKNITELLEGKLQLPYSVLDDAVKNATKALQDAQTQLVFSDNGILAIDKNDPNLVTLFNSAGIGISDDGGATFGQALTGQGLNVDYVYAGTMLADRIAGGILESLNGNTHFNLNSGELDMRNANFTLGNGAHVNFTDSNNKIYYKKNTDGVMSAGLGFGDSINNQYPVTYVGTSQKERPEATTESFFSGFIANTRKRTSADGVGNSAIGNVFDVRDKANDYEKGFRFNLAGNNMSISTFRNDLYNYDIGTIRRLLVKRDFTVRQYGNEDSGWLLETNHSDGEAITLRGLNGDSYAYQIGADSTNRRIRNIYLANSPNVSSDKRLKENIKNNILGLDFINRIETKSFKLKNKESVLQFGILAQQLKEVLSDYGYDKTEFLSKGTDGMYGVRHEQFFAPLIKAIQELHQKMEELKRESV